MKKTISTFNKDVILYLCSVSSCVKQATQNHLKYCIGTTINKFES